MSANLSALELPDRTTHPTVAGFVKPGFEAVREAFAENFTHRDELGAACAIYYNGEKVVDLWGGVRDKATGYPWEEDTMVIVHSTTKGMAGLALALAHSRGLLDYEERVCTYWPEFAQAGKDRVTVRQLLSHQAGLFALDAPVDRDIVSDSNRLAVALAQQKPAWEPGQGRLTTPSVLVFMKASCSGGLTRSAAVWAASSRMKSPRLWGWIFTSGFPKRFPIPGWRRSKGSIRLRHSYR